MAKTGRRTTKKPEADGASPAADARGKRAVLRTRSGRARAEQSADAAAAASVDPAPVTEEPLPATKARAKPKPKTRRSSPHRSPRRSSDPHVRAEKVAKLRERIAKLQQQLAELTDEAGERAATAATDERAFGWPS